MAGSGVGSRQGSAGRGHEFEADLVKVDSPPAGLAIANRAPISGESGTTRSSGGIGLRWRPQRPDRASIVVAAADGDQRPPPALAVGILGGFPQEVMIDDQRRGELGP